MRRMNKKGADWKVIFEIILALAVLGLILYGTVPAIRDFFKTGKELQACGGMGFANGECVSSPSACSGTYFKGLGCEGKTPICCFKDKKEVDEASSSCKDNWADCDKCQVKLTGMELRPAEPKLKQDFEVTCITNIQNVPCLSVEITNSQNSNKAYCNYVTNQPFNTKEKIFNCASRLLPAGITYTVSCVLADSGTKGHFCCIEGKDSAEKAENKQISKSFELKAE